MSDLAVEQAQMREEIQALLEKYLDTMEGFERNHISAWYIVAEVVTPELTRTRLEVSDDQSSQYTSMGLLFSALHDPRWL